LENQKNTWEKNQEFKRIEEHGKSAEPKVT
jgi:hypothetical protein